MLTEQGDIRQYLNVLYRRKWLILGLAVVATSIAAAFVLRITPMYRATTTVMIESKEANVVSIQDVYGMDTRAQEYYQTQFEIMKSRPVVDTVVQRLQLNKRSEFAVNAPNNEIAGIAIADIYLANLRVSPIPRTQLVKVSFDADDPKLAAAIANAHAEAFIENYLSAKESVTHSATEWMGGRLDELRSKLTAAEARLQAFKEREQLVDIEGFQALPARQLNELTSKLIDARRDLSQTNNTYAQVAQVRDAGLDEKLTIPAIRSDPLVQQLRQARSDAELKVAELSKRYGPLHPKMRSAISERSSIDQSLTHQVDSVMEAIKNEHDALRGQAQSIAAAVDNTKADVQLVGRKESEYRALLRDVETNRQLFDMFYKRISETSETTNLDSANARVVEPASVPLITLGPEKNLILGLAFLLASAVGVILAFVLEIFDNTIKHAVDVERKLGAAVLGLVPLLRESRGGPLGNNRESSRSMAQEFRNHSNREFSESIRTVRTSVTLSSLDDAQKLIMVTSSLAGEGKTTVACNLALSFAQLERVLLIDADLRRPSVATELDLLRTGPGFSELCANTATALECVEHSDLYNMDILTAGSVPINPQELLSSRRLHDILAEFKDRYDRIVIDCPPVLPVSDALLLANCSDALVYVVKAESTTVAQVKTGLQKFKRAPVKLLGVVLNQVDMKKLAAYGEYGGGYYGSYFAASTADIDHREVAVA